MIPRDQLVASNPDRPRLPNANGRTGGQRLGCDPMGGGSRMDEAPDQLHRESWNSTVEVDGGKRSRSCRHLTGVDPAQHNVVFHLCSVCFGIFQDIDSRSSSVISFAPVCFCGVPESRLCNRDPWTRSSSSSPAVCGSCCDPDPFLTFTCTGSV